MRVLVYPHAMEIGGSQLNAVQLAGAVRDLGHEVIVLSEPGPMVDRVHALDLEHIEIPMLRGWPSARIARTLVRVVRDRRIDLVHGYEWGPVMEAFFGPKLRCGTPVVGTIMAMTVEWSFPRAIHLIVGTEELRETAIAGGRSKITLLEPPVDTDSDDPALVDGREFRKTHGIRDDELLVVIVSRLASALKLEGLLTACDAVGELARSQRVRLVIVGGGPMHDQVAAQAAAANATAGRQAVLLAGEMADPRTAYAAADIVIGMGGSALRALAFGKPLIVIGEDGFSEILTPASVSRFLKQGWYGTGPGSLGAGAPALGMALQQLTNSADLRRDLSASARQLVIDRFSLHRAAKLQEHIYLSAIDDRTSLFEQAKDFAYTATGVSGRILRRQYPSFAKTPPPLH
ncbi:glycosyltransferase [Bradyrhizobium sp. SYSU BS000235]|uniref:glycosyltransferase n=1 Tax=Bradyrhizobium sp. SYSU BS000235 TaxID=3411332 RepID=UPI003C77A638